MATTDGDEMTGMPEGATPIYDVNGSTGMADVIRGLEDVGTCKPCIGRGIALRPVAPLCPLRYQQVYAMTREAGNAPKDFKEGVEGLWR